MDKQARQSQMVGTMAVWGMVTTWRAAELGPVEKKREIKEWTGVGRIQDRDQCWRTIVCMAGMPSVVIKLPSHR